MLALYRNGRQADALVKFAQIRRRLADELGADPTPALQRLHQQVLTADPALAAHLEVRTTRAAVEPSVPRQLPAAPRGFTGRASSLPSSMPRSQTRVSRQPRYPFLRCGVAPGWERRR